MSLIVILFSLFGLCAPSPSHADEIHTNGTGGGTWSDPATWRGRKVPAPEDDAVIARGDNVVFDRNDEERITCNHLSIDPDGVLDFKTRSGKRVFCLADSAESFGTIKLDGTKAAGDHLELRFVGKKPENRAIKFDKGGVLLVSGRPNLPKGRRNALVTSFPPDADKVDPQATIDAIAGTTLDIRRGEITNVLIRGTNIDNTGAKPNERLNILESRFTGRAWVSVNSCDTPVIADNTFERIESTFSSTIIAIHLYGCPLAEVRGNTIRGRYQMGIQGVAQTDSIVMANTIEGCITGIYWYGANAMLKQIAIRDCDTGVVITSMSGALEDFTLENCKNAIYQVATTSQLTNVKVHKNPKDGVVFLYHSGTVTLINCNILPDQFKKVPEWTPAVSAEKVRPSIVESMQYLIVSTKGKAAVGGSIDVRTTSPATPLAAGAADLNVRNSPARILSSGMTPFPRSLEPLTVRTWVIDADGKLLASPTYALTIYGPPIAGTETPKALKTTIVTPQASWYREEPNSREATVEVMVP